MVEFSEPVTVTPAADGKLTLNMIMLRSRGEQLDAISKINLWGLSVTDITIIRSMRNLRIVSMSTNKLRGLEPFGHCLFLQELYLRSNHIADIHEVAHLKHLTRLQKIWLEDNPCANASIPETQKRTVESSGLSTDVTLDTAGEEDSPMSVISYRLSVVRNLIHLTHLDHKAVTPEERLQAETEGLLLTAPPPLMPASPVPEKKTPEDNSENPTEQLCSTMESVVSCELDMDMTESELSTDLFLSIFSQIRSECGLKPLTKCKISPPVRNLRSPLVEHERLIRNAVLRLLKTLNPHSLEIVIHAAERRLSRFDRLNSPQPPNGIDAHIGSLTTGYWAPSDDYDHTNYMDYSR
ncbi:hypothetical protein PHET_03851 [Paragonimus heterotremus]|uniref:Uncharacterized protein n=1 Tax=Paragonimus heterotremus TaxID=100268 RepID=A0A8J4WSB3_9TREM|nr:hypothetical protein PHET_03851 [Paragonimus heterotremus]